MYVLDQLEQQEAEVYDILPHENHRKVQHGRYFQINHLHSQLTRCVFLCTWY